MEAQALLTVSGLCKRYGTVAAVDNISFSVMEGEVFGLLGPNGAGKTTLIRMLCGLLKPDSGIIRLEGLSFSSSYSIAKSLIGLCPQEIVVWEQLTCREQLVFMGLAYGLSAKAARQNAEALLADFGLSEQAGKLARTLSGGMLRRLNISLALVHHPRLLILDEPQAGLDPQSRIRVRDTIRQLARRTTVILTTHDMEEADRLCDRISIVDHGQILVTGTPYQLKQNGGSGELLQIRLKPTDQNSLDLMLHRLPDNITEVNCTDNQLLLTGNDPPAAIPAIHQLMAEMQLTIDEIIVRKRTLEDAFIKLTGRGLRE